MQSKVTKVMRYNHDHDVLLIVESTPLPLLALNSHTDEMSINRNPAYATMQSQRSASLKSDNKMSINRNPAYATMQSQRSASLKSDNDKISINRNPAYTTTQGQESAGVMEAVYEEIRTKVQGEK